MIEINLLPVEMRKKKIDYVKLNLQMGNFKLFIGGIVAGILILMILVLSMGSSVRKKQTLNLMAKEAVIAPKKSQIEIVNREVMVLNNKMEGVSELTKRNFLWAKKLNELSDLVLPGIWFTRIHTDLDQTFIIEGSVISKKEGAMAIVGKFIKSLRGHSSFFKDFSNIELKTVQRKNIDEKDVVDFRIALYF